MIIIGQNEEKKSANLLAIPSLKLVDLTQANLYAQTRHNIIGLNNANLKVISIKKYLLYICIYFGHKINISDNQVL